MRRRLLSAVAVLAVAAAAATTFALAQSGAAGPVGPPSRSTEPALAVVGTLEITGRSGTLVEAGTPVHAFSSELVSPRDAASGLPTGKRQHKPFTITKQLDKSSPLLFQALVSNETLPSLKLSLLPREGGAVYATIELTNASIASRRASDNGKHDTHELEEITFVFQKISWTWVEGGITAEDDWNDPES